MTETDVITAWLFFIFQLAMFVATVYVAKRIITDRYQMRMEKPPDFIRTRYLVAASVCMAVIFFVPVMKAHALYYQEAYSVMPWYGDKAVRVSVCVVAVLCSFAIAYLTDDNR
ncbi:hypothetical protein ACFVMS_004451 [Salmonella enterica]